MLLTLHRARSQYVHLNLSLTQKPTGLKRGLYYEREQLAEDYPDDQMTN
jgi:hypothetical protein